MSRGGQTKRPLSHTPSLQLSVAGSSGAAQHWQGQPQRFQRPPPSSSGTLAPRGGSMPGPPHHLPPPRGTPAHYPPYGRPHGPGYPQQHTSGGQFGGPRPAAPPFGPPRPPQRAPPLPMPKPFDDNDDLFDQALAAVVDPIPVKKHAASTTPEPPVVPPGQQAAPVPSSSSVPPDHSTRLYPALGSLSESVAASPPPPSEPSTQQLVRPPTPLCLTLP